MASLNQFFDANNVAPAQEFTPLPTGEYVAQITDSDIKDSKKGGQYIYFELEVCEGVFAGRKLFERLNIYHSNPQVVEIAQKQLSAICHATGQLKINDTQDLHYRPMLVRVKYEEGKGDYGPQNSIKAYKSRVTAAPQPVVTEQQSNAAPWQPSTPAAPTAPAKTKKATPDKPPAFASAAGIDDDIPF